MINNVVEYIERSAYKFPDKIFLKTPKEEITFSYFLDKCRREASFIASKYHMTRKPILVSINRDPQCLIDMMAIAMSGNYYIPVDLTQPTERIKQFVDISKVSIAIADEKDFPKLRNVSDSLNLNSNISMGNSSIDTQLLTSIRQESCPTDPLYAMFTSGSTGVPKGVVNSHGSVIAFIDAFSDLFDFTSQNNHGNHTTFDFDISVKDIFLTMKNGSTMHIFPKSFVLFPTKLIEYINKNNIDIAIWSVPILKFIQKYDLLRQGIIPSTLKKIFFSGEEMPATVLNYWMKYFPNADYYNVYGPTECTCNCLYYKINRIFQDTEPLPIGHSFPNGQVLLFNDENKIVQQDEIGEICVRGASLATGYLNNPEKTAEVFVQNPLVKEYRDIIYRTGDLGKYDKDGEIIFLGRKDSQIKYNSHRIELGEIELCTRQISNVNDVFCFFNKKTEEIVLVYASDLECNNKVISYLRNKFPQWMIPRKIHHLKEMPINSRLKIDRVLLQKMYSED